MATRKLDESIAGRIKSAREQAQLDSVEMRAALKQLGIQVSKAGLHRLENVEPRNPNLEMIHAISEITGVSPAWILFGEGTTYQGDSVGDAIRGRVLDTMELMSQALDMTARQEKTWSNWLESMRSSKPKKVSKP